MKIILIFFNLFLSLSLLAQSQEKLSPGQSIKASLKQTGYELLMPWLLVDESVGELWGGYKYKQNFKEQTNPDHLESWLTLWGSGSTVGKINWQNIVPPKDVTEVLTNTGKEFGPIETSYLAYRKLHNKTVDENNFLSNGISWGYSIIRFHQAKNDNNKTWPKTGAVTGWRLGGGADYQTLGAYKDISRVFTGYWSVSKEGDPMHIEWEDIGKDGKTHNTEGFEKFAGTLFPDSDVIQGRWNGYVSRLESEKMKNQSGLMGIILNSSVPGDYSFDMDKVTRDITWDEKMVKERITEFSNAAFLFGANCFPYFFSTEDQEQLIAYYVHKAWEAYEDYLPKDFKEKKDVITKDFTVHIKEKFISDSQKFPVPAQFFKLFQDPKNSRKWGLNISYDFFSKFDIDTAISKIAHEIIGHGIIHRDYVYIPMSFFVSDIKPEVPSEGFATCVEYNVLESLYNKKGMCSPYSNLETFADALYKGDTQDYYSPGIKLLKKQDYIKDDKVDWDKVKSSLQKCKNTTDKLIIKNKIKFNN